MGGRERGGRPRGPQGGRGLEKIGVEGIGKKKKVTIRNRVQKPLDDIWRGLYVL
jgi:hypothetical protein